MATESNQLTVEMLEKLLDAFNSHEIDAVTSFFADDCVLEMPRGTRIHGGEGWKGGSESARDLRAASPVSPTLTTATRATGSPASAAAPNGS